MQDRRDSSSLEKDLQLNQRLRRAIGQALADYSMIRDGDSIMVGLSGGKDSLILLVGLAALKKRSPVAFTLRAGLLDPTGGSMDTSLLEDYTAMLKIPLEIERYPIFEIIRERNESSPCSFCANMRRGILSRMAQAQGCTSLALGHHLDDVVETAMLNLFYAGRFCCFQPKLWMDRSKIFVVRPLIYIEENWIVSEVSRLDLPVLEQMCPYAKGSRRYFIKNFLNDMEKSNPAFRRHLLHALQQGKGTGFTLKQKRNE